MNNRLSYFCSSLLLLLFVLPYIGKISNKVATDMGMQSEEK